MNSEQVLSLVRQILLAGGGFAVGKGWVDNETMIAVVGAILVLISSGWAFWERRDKAIVQAAAAKVPISDTAQKAVGIENPVKPS